MGVVLGILLPLSFSVAVLMVLVLAGIGNEENTIFLHILQRSTHVSIVLIIHLSPLVTFFGFYEDNLITIVSGLKAVLHDGHALIAACNHRNHILKHTIFDTHSHPLISCLASTLTRHRIHLRALLSTNNPVDINQCLPVATLLPDLHCGFLAHLVAPLPRPLRLPLARPASTRRA